MPALHGHHQGPVGEGDARLRRGGQQPPRRVLEGPGEVLGRAPGHPVIARADEHQLRALPHLVPGFRPQAHPLMLALLPLHPESEAEDLARLRVDNQPRVTAPVERLGQPARLPHVHDDPDRFPGLAPVDTARQSNVDVFLQVAPRPAAQVVHAQQRPLGGTGERGNSAGVHAILPGTPHRHPQPMTPRGHVVFRNQFLPRQHHLGHVGGHLVRQVGFGLHPARQPEDMPAGGQSLRQRERQQLGRWQRGPDRGLGRPAPLGAGREERHLVEVAHVVAPGEAELQSLQLDGVSLDLEFDADQRGVVESREQGMHESTHPGPHPGGGGSREQQCQPEGGPARNHSTHGASCHTGSLHRDGRERCHGVHQPWCLRYALSHRDKMTF